MKPDDVSTLLDWKRRIFALYERVRSEPDPRAAWVEWRRTRDRLFAEHPQSPIAESERSGFSELPFFDYDPAYRVTARIEDLEPVRYEIGTSGEDPYSFVRFGAVTFEVSGERLALETYWLEGYGGGLFLPFRDGTSGDTTYGAGRYLLDTVKGADLGTEGGEFVLDFNFAYNPSCSYDPRWVCPLAPPPNRLDVRIEAGEKHDP